MKKPERLIKFLLKPPLWICIAVWAVGVVSLAGSITLYYMGLGLELWAVSVHAVALIFLILSVYAVLALIGIPERTKDKPKVRKFFSSYSTRAFIYAVGAVLFNCCYIVFGIVMANLEHSAWLGVLVGYHVFLLLPRAEVLITAKFRGRDKGPDAEVRQIRAYANCGLLLVMLAVAILPVIKMTIDDANSYRYFTGAVVYVTAVAAYTFTKLVIASYNMKKARRQSDYALIAVKNTSFADALISLFTLQAMMLKELKIDAGTAALASKLNPIVGAVIAAVIFSIGLGMIIRGKKRLKTLPSPQSTTVTADSNDRNGSSDGQADS